MKCALFLAEGFEDCEAMITVDMLRRGGVAIDTVSITESTEVCSSHKVRMQADLVWSQFHEEDYEVLILPGGKLGTKNMEACAPLIQALQEHWRQGKLTCAICAAPSILGHLGLLKGKRYTCFPEFEDPAFGGAYQMELAVKDGSLITGRGMGATIEFAREILKEISPDTLARVEYGMQYEHSFRTSHKPRA